jgi:hypothetical protein
VIADVLPYASRTDHPGYLAFIPSFTTWPAALAELTATAANPYCGAWMIELEVIDWFRTWLGLPAHAAGVLVSGGSAANMTALLGRVRPSAGRLPTVWCTCRTRLTRRWPGLRAPWDCGRIRSGCCRPTVTGAYPRTR